MSFAPSVEPERDARLSGRRPSDRGNLEPAADSGHRPPFAGPTALRPEAVLQRQAVLGNAAVSRVFRSAAVPDQKQGCNCPDEEHCSCPK